MPNPSSGDTPMPNGYVFRWIVQGDRTPEIYGWLEMNHDIIRGTGGFWRTDDPEEAVRRCKVAFPERFEEKAS